MTSAPLRGTVILVFLAACQDKGEDSVPALVGGDTCTALESGAWYSAGSALGMPSASTEMTVSLSMDPDSCLFSLSDWNMDMGAMPDQGALDGAAVQLGGPTSYWSSCTGTAADARTVTGTCADDDAVFELWMD